ncbi:uncharacterized protein [Engystomops pustulosus]|uniref:uncharacterized protein n=1 Tax=Engystomops pustulosus TaxID=76066 RepID=UPI003AFB0A6A
MDCHVVKLFTTLDFPAGRRTCRDVADHMVRTQATCVAPPSPHSDSAMADDVVLAEQIRARVRAEGTGWLLALVARAAPASAARPPARPPSPSPPRGRRRSPSPGWIPAPAAARPPVSRVREAVEQLLSGAPSNGGAYTAAIDYHHVSRAPSNGGAYTAAAQLHSRAPATGGSYTAEQLSSRAPSTGGSYTAEQLSSRAPSTGGSYTAALDHLSSRAPSTGGSYTAALDHLSSRAPSTGGYSAAQVSTRAPSTGGHPAAPAHDAALSSVSRVQAAVEELLARARYATGSYPNSSELPAAGDHDARSLVPLTALMSSVAAPSSSAMGFLPAPSPSAWGLPVDFDVDVPPAPSARPSESDRRRRSRSRHSHSRCRRHRHHRHHKRSRDGSTSCRRHKRSRGRSSSTSRRRHKRSRDRLSSRRRHKRSRSFSSTSGSSFSYSSGSSYSGSLSPERTRRRRQRHRRRRVPRSSQERSAQPVTPAAPPAVEPRPQPSAPVTSGIVTGFSAVLHTGGSEGFPMPSFPMNAERRLLPLMQTSVAPSARLSHGRRPVVWMIGDSFIQCAEQAARTRPGGSSLGFQNADIFWNGVRGLKWLQVMPAVVAASRATSAPTVVVIHAGGNDICKTKLGDLLTLICTDLDRFCSFFCEVVLVWSEVVPRTVWPGARKMSAVEKSRRLLNTRVSRYIRSLGGMSIRNRQLEGDNRALLLSDGVHLNEAGLDIFLSGLQEGVEQALQLLTSKANQVRGPHSP